MKQAGSRLLWPNKLLKSRPSSNNFSSMQVEKLLSMIHHMTDLQILPSLGSTLEWQLVEGRLSRHVLNGSKDLLAVTGS
eukprot:12192779-Karenia_brevis.AAC.1